MTAPRRPASLPRAWRSSFHGKGSDDAMGAIPGRRAGGKHKQKNERGAEHARKPACSDKHAVSPRNENCLRGLASPFDFGQRSFVASASPFETRRAYDRIGKCGSANAHRQEIVSTNNMYTHLFRKWSALISRSRNAKS